jgi:hypothetical protein
MLKEFLTKQVLKYQLKDLPEDQRVMIMALVEKNPELFKKIGEEVQEKTKGGADQMMATMMVMKKYERELRALAGR